MRKFDNSDANHDILYAGRIPRRLQTKLTPVYDVTLLQHRPTIAPTWRQ